jgi:hypothetical protein
MSKKYSISMFEKIKDALKKTERTPSGSFANIIKFPAGHTYTLRLIPDVDGLESGDDKTFFHHYLNQWTSKKDGSFVNAISLKSFGERDPINEVRWKLYKGWKDTEPAKDEKFENPIKEKEAWFVNVYVIDDPANPENNGTVKILNMGPQLKTIVDAAMTGEDADEFGAAIFDLSKDGCDFKIKAEEQGIYTTYKSSRFSSKTKLDLTDKEIDEVYASVHDLTQVYPVKTVEELQALLEEHFDTDGVVEPKKEERKSIPKKETKPKADKKVSEEPEDEIPMDFDTDSLRSSADTDVDDLLKELDID